MDPVTVPEDTVPWGDFGNGDHGTDNVGMKGLGDVLLALWYCTTHVTAQVNMHELRSRTNNETPKIKVRLQHLT
jgi:hypothetical protein